MSARPPQDAIAALGGVAANPSVQSALDAVLELLGMDVAYTTAFEDGEQVFTKLRGDAASFGIAEGARMPLADTYCHQILAERMPAVISDMRAEPVGAAMAVTEAAGVRAYASVPLVLSDGRLYGTLCCASHDARSLDARDERFLHVLARIVAGELERAEHEALGRRLHIEAASVRALVAAMEARDRYTSDHALAVVELASRVARQLGLDEAQIAEAEQVALLHDIGKIAIPDTVLHHPGSLDDDQWVVMRTHSQTSERIVASIAGIAHLAAAVRAEHERWDGRGYPDGLAGEAIPIASRIVFVCDAYHAMTSDRPYRRRMSHADAELELRRCAGSQFDPTVVGALLASL